MVKVTSTMSDEEVDFIENIEDASEVEVDNQLLEDGKKPRLK